MTIARVAGIVLAGVFVVPNPDLPCAGDEADNVQPTRTHLQRSDLKRITMMKAPSAVRSVGFDPQDTKFAIGTETGMVQIHPMKN